MLKYPNLLNFGKSRNKFVKSIAITLFPAIIILSGFESVFIFIYLSYKVEYYCNGDKERGSQKGCE